MLIEREYWSPTQRGSWTVCGPGVRRPRPAAVVPSAPPAEAEAEAEADAAVDYPADAEAVAEGEEEVEAEGYDEDEDDDAPGPPLPIVRPTVIIWHRHTCEACQLNAHLFAALEADGRSRDGERWTVVRVQATPRQLRRFPHVTQLPLYDLVRPSFGAASPYGRDTLLRSVPNSARAPLEAEFPAAARAAAAQRVAATTTR